MANPKVTVAIAGDPRGLNRAFKSAGGAAAGFGRTVARTAAVGMAALGAGAVVVGAKLFDTAVELEKMRDKAEVVFGDSMGMVDEWAKANAHAMSMTTNEAIGVAASIADVLVPMGFARDEAANMATDITGLTGALAEWDSQQRSAAEIGLILQNAFTGERDALKSLGSVFGEAEVQAKMLEMGMEDLEGEALKQAVALATLELVTESTSDAQTSFAENSDSMSRKMGEAKAKMRELWEQLAIKLAPAFTEVATFLVDEVVPAIESVAGWLDENLTPAFQTIAGFITGTVVPALRNLWQWFSQKILPKIVEVGEKVGGWLVEKFQVIVDFIRDPVIVWLRNLWQWFAQKIVPIVVKVGQKVGGFLLRAFTTIKNFIKEQLVPRLKDLWSRLKSVADAIADVGIAAWRDANPYLQDMLDIIKPYLENAVDDLKESVDNLTESFENLGLSSTEAQILVGGLISLALIPLATLVLGIVGLFAGWIALFMGLAYWFRVLTDQIRAWSVVWGEVWGAIKWFVEGIIGFIQDAIDKVNELIGLIGGIPGKIAEALNPLSGGFPNPFNIFGKSSLVVGPAAGGLASIPRPGRAATSGGVTVVVQGSVLSERDLVRTIRDAVTRGGAERHLLAGIGRS